MADKWTPETPWFGGDKKTKAYWPPYVCRNPNCASYGKSHPNCRCGPPSLRSQYKNLEYAHGGAVHYCMSGVAHHESCEHYAEGGQVEENLKLHEQPGLSVDHAAIHHGLLHLLTDMGHSRSENPNKPMEDYMDSSRRGHKELNAHIDGLFDRSHENKEPDPKDVSALKDHLESINENPSQMLEIGGSLGSSFPDHAGELAAKAATAVNYLKQLKPKPQQLAPLDEPTQPDKMEDSHYDRQLAIAQQPMSVLEHMKCGTLMPDDLTTLHTIYPKLSKQMIDKTTGALIDAKTKETEIPYKHKMALGHFLGTHLDFTGSPQAAQAIIKSALPMQAAAQSVGKGKKQGATAQTQKTIERANEMYETPLEARQTNRKA